MGLDRHERECLPPADLDRERAAERNLVLAAKAGDPGARAQLIETFLPLIATVGRRYRRSGSVDRLELTQEGIAGLLAALQRFEPERGTPFWAYARWWVRQAMQQLTAELTGPVVLSDRALRQLARVKHARRTFQQARGTDPSVDELADASGVSREEVDRLVAVERPAVALADSVWADTDPRSEEAYERVVHQSEIEEVRCHFDELDERKRTILRARFGLGGRAQTLREIASGLGISAERVRQIEQCALDELRTAGARLA
jgi:RNA polymerase sigma factor (sigma-70 family)